VVAHELCDPLRPSIAVHLGSTAKGLRAAMQPTLAELQQQRQAAKAFAAIWNKGLAWLRTEQYFFFGSLSPSPRSLTLAQWRTLGNLVACRSLPSLWELHIRGADSEDAVEGTALLAEGFRRGGLPSLRVLTFDGVMIGPVNLATCLTTLQLPALKDLRLQGTSMGDEGLGALAPALRQLPLLQHLHLDENLIGDRGVALLLAEPMEGVLPNLSELSLSSNMLTNACLPHLELICDPVVNPHAEPLPFALRLERLTAAESAALLAPGGALPAITKIDLRHNTIAAFEPGEIGYWRESLPNVSFYF